MKSKFLQRISFAVVPRICSWIIKIWFGTCRIIIHGQREKDRVDGMQGPVIGAFWHYGVIGYLYVLRDESSVVLVSASSDGEYIARLAGHFGLPSVRGSRNKGGLHALKELLKKIREGQNVGIVADGSQGPPRVVQAGAILLASKTGVPILPMIWSSSRYIAINSWDRLVLPKPFSRIDFYYGEPLEVPKGLDSAGIEEYRVSLEERMNNLYNEAWIIQGRQEH